MRGGRSRAWCNDDLVRNQDHGAGNMNREVWVRITGALLLAGHWSLAGASALSDAAAALQPGQWVQLNTQNFNSQLLVDGNYDLFYYTEDMTWDPVSRQLLFVGGGHDNFATAGVENLIIVQDGDAVLVADKRDEAAIKKLVEHLKQCGLEKYL